MKKAEKAKSEDPKKKAELKDEELNTAVGGVITSGLLVKSFDPQPEPPGIITKLNASIGL